MTNRKVQKGPQPIDPKRVGSAAIVCGCLCVLILEKAMALQAADWAARGQPWAERWLDRVLWTGLGFAVGALLGACIAIAWARAGGAKRRRR